MNFQGQANTQFDIATQPSQGYTSGTIDSGEPYVGMHWNPPSESARSITTALGNVKQVLAMDYMIKSLERKRSKDESRREFHRSEDIIPTLSLYNLPNTAGEKLYDQVMPFSSTRIQSSTEGQSSARATDQSLSMSPYIRTESSTRQWTNKIEVQQQPPSGGFQLKDIEMVMSKLLTVIKDMNEKPPEVSSSQTPGRAEQWKQMRNIIEQMELYRSQEAEQKGFQSPEVITTTSDRQNEENCDFHIQTPPKKLGKPERFRLSPEFSLGKPATSEKYEREEEKKLWSEPTDNKRRKAFVVRPQNEIQQFNLDELSNDTSSFFSEGKTHSERNGQDEHRSNRTRDLNMQEDRSCHSQLTMLSPSDHLSQSSQVKKRTRNGYQDSIVNRSTATALDSNGQITRNGSNVLSVRNPSQDFSPGKRQTLPSRSKYANNYNQISTTSKLKTIQAKCKDTKDVTPPRKLRASRSSEKFEVVKGEWMTQIKNFGNEIRTMKAELNTYTKNAQSSSNMRKGEVTSSVRRGHMLYERAMNKIQRQKVLREKTIESREMEKLRACTFTPKVNKTAELDGTCLEERQARWLEIKSDKMALLKSKQAWEDARKCSFFPFGQPSPYSILRTADEFYEDNIRWQQRVKTKSFLKSAEQELAEELTRLENTRTHSPITKLSKTKSMLKLGGTIACESSAKPSGRTTYRDIYLHTRRTSDITSHNTTKNCGKENKSFTAKKLKRTDVVQLDALQKDLDTSPAKRLRSLERKKMLEVKEKINEARNSIFEAKKPCGMIYAKQNEAEKGTKAQNQWKISEQAKSFLDHQALFRPLEESLYYK
eukprot:TRINITY_DN3676_c0_g5_i1.p1 TRINITY_DN3676_c0_g5~~TRINITY_DN3676_c0_g5_i1.p1  ORF type:complete len:822 (+),score=182.96 TRINITY_DN3676_c0_g5_i1:34-2499(+)